jgi:hypothetical protein
MKAQRRTAAEWTGIVERWRASGLSALEFGEAQGLKSSTLSWWGAQLGRAQGKSPGQEGQGFTQLRVVPAAVGGGSVEVHSRSGLWVRVEGAVDPDALVSILRAVSRC